MTLTPYHPVAKPAHKRALVPGASPWAPAAPPTTVDPAVYAAKKADFISQLFSGLGPAAAGGAPPVGPDFWMPPAPPTTPSPDDPMGQATLLAQLVNAVVNAPEPTVPYVPFVAPTPKPTIVPPGFWVPDSPIMPPGAYKAKVATFLSKLFSSLNITMGPGAAAKVARHSGRPQTSWARDLLTALPPALAAAPAPAPASPAATADPKDMVINSILSEVAQLKTAFMDTLGDMLARQKEIAAAVPTKKPKFLPPWVPTPPPTIDPMEPFQKRIDTLGQVFDMLTNLGKVVTGPAAPSNGSAAPSARAVRSVPMRSVQMAVHQGYQSMPPGTEEVISAGAGRDPDSNHEGGGLNLKVQQII
jgi:hypothetical protein